MNNFLSLQTHFQPYSLIKIAKQNTYSGLNRFQRRTEKKMVDNLNLKTLSELKQWYRPEEVYLIKVIYGLILINSKGTWCLQHPYHATRTRGENNNSSSSYEIEDNK